MFEDIFAWKLLYSLKVTKIPLLQPLSPLVKSVYLWSFLASTLDSEIVEIPQVDS